MGAWTDRNGIELQQMHSCKIRESTKQEKTAQEDLHPCKNQGDHTLGEVECTKKIRGTG